MTRADLGSTHDAPTDLVTGADGARRCWWAAATPELERYHDVEWGRGGRDERDLFERLSLEAFQAGLSWRIVLERRPALRAAFADFEPAAVATLGPGAADRILATPGTIRNRAKVTAVLANARVLVDLHASGSGLGRLTEAVLAERPLPSGPPPRRRDDVPASTPTSALLATRLRASGWRFVGPTTAYAYLQATGWVDDHLKGCHARRRPGRERPLR